MGKGNTHTHTLATRQPPKKLKNTTSVTQIMGSGPGAEPHAVHRLYVAAEVVTSIKKNMTLSLRVRERSGDNCRMMEEEESKRASLWELVQCRHCFSLTPLCAYCVEIGLLTAIPCGNRSLDMHVILSHTHTHTHTRPKTLIVNDRDDL